MKFKRIISMLCITAMFLSFTACGKDNNSKINTDSQITSSTEKTDGAPPATEGASKAETETTTSSKSETTTTSKAPETTTTVKPETTTTTKTPETTTTVKPETTTTTKTPETTTAVKPETTTTTKTPETTTAAKLETTTVVTDTPDVKPAGHCEGFNKLWGKRFIDIGITLEEQGWYSATGGWENETKGGRCYALQSETLEMLDLKIPINGCCYSNTQAVYFLFEVCSSEYNNLNTIYGFQLWGGGPNTMGNFEYCDQMDYNLTGELCPDFNDIFSKLKELYGEPSRTRLEGELKVYLWSNTLDGEIVLANDITFNGKIDYNTVCLEFLQSGHKLTQDQINYHFDTDF